ncbi:zona pellucida sperm-binding protein 3-like [Sceloporus undulatus]|uniref:zona pellucida sperm-binding protein 3-like n=1 Tax=Sceloporus undulatus TaxID=8520 RepID=UPI001C4D12AA|nr:zona pellucida sperm-binding protein 3-like [Sceloporus undulatus]
MGPLLVLGFVVSFGWRCLAQWRGQADIPPWAPNWVLPPAAQPYAPRSRGAHAVTVKCEPHQVVVTVHQDLFGVGRLVAPADLTLGVTPCLPVSFDPMTNLVVFEAGLHQCGSTVQMTPDWLIYKTSLFYAPSLANNPVIVRTNAAEIPIECHYPRKGNLTSRAIKPTWAPFSSTMAAEARLGFSLRLMKDDWSAERTSAHFQLGDTLRLQADVHTENHLPLRVFVDSCTAGPSPEATLAAQYAIIDSHGCLLDGRQDSVSSAFLSPRPRQESLRFMVDAFRFAGNPRNLIYITCRLKVTPAEQVPDDLNKACSFGPEANLWHPVEGPRNICRCCESQNCGHISGVRPHSFSSRFEMSWQRSLQVETDAHQAQLVLGPLLVSDAQESVRTVPDDPEEDEEMVIEEEFLPVIKPKEEEEETGTQFPSKEQEGSINVSEEEAEPGVPWEAYVRGGPIFLGEGEDSSGFEDQTKAAVPEEERTALDFKAEVVSRPLEDALPSPTPGKFSMEALRMAAKKEERTALEFKAELVSRPLEDALPSSTPGKFPVEGANMAAKGPEQSSGGVVLLSLCLLMAGVIVTFLILGALLFRRCRHSNSALRPSAFATEL